MPEPVAPDQAARARVAEDLDHTLFVEAGAGSGKTTALVTRVLSLVETGRAELAEVAAITFTDKAATELRDRLRHHLESRAGAPADGTVIGRRRFALEQLDGAAIGTLHSFAQRILSEHPVEAGLPPRVEVVDEVSSDIAFERRWVAFRDRLLADPSLERTILLLDAAGIRISAVRTLAVAFGANWDLVKTRVPESAPEAPAVADLLAPVLFEIDDICAEKCSNPDDLLRLGLDAVAGYVAELRSIDDELDLLEALQPGGPLDRPSFKLGNRGRAEHWSVDPKELQGRLRDAEARLLSVGTEVANACVERIGSTLRGFTLEAAEERRSAGQLEFHDLLVLARELLRHPEHGTAVRRRLHGRYRHLLLDELQDTDPIQIELAVLIAAADDRLDDGPLPWDEVEVAPGQLFFVGDPKQSIYRFRRADISTFLDAGRRFGAGGDTVELTANFRTVRPVIEWVNATFGRLLAEPDAVDMPVASQPRYVSLQAVRTAGPVGPPVGVIGRGAHDKDFKADDIRQAEATEVAGGVAQIIWERWSVDDGNGGWRPAQLGDVTILVPARTSLPFLERALDELDIPYRAETSSLVYSSRAVRDLLMVLRSLSDPTNQLHLVSALRTPLFACGDDDLFRFKVEFGGRWSFVADQPDTVPATDPVHRALSYLAGLYDERNWLSPSELLDRLSRERRAMDLGFAEGRPRDVWRRIRFVIDQARAWNEATGANLRQYLRWVELQTADGARVAEAILPETDDDAVRIMTIHAAKGLEFPITVVSGMSTAPDGRYAAAQVVFPPGGSVGYKVGRFAETAEFAEWAPVDEQMGLHERIRLLYVACTRARDHLVVSLHRKVRASEAKPERRTNAELLVESMGELLDGLEDIGVVTGDVTAPAVRVPSALLPHGRWASEREEALRAASRPTTVSATSLTEEGEPDVEEEPPDPGLQKRPRDLDLPPWLKGRYGTAVGRAVHGVLQTIDLDSGAGLDDAVASQCEAEAIVDRADDVRRLVGYALAAPSVKEAASSPHWREVYVCAPVEGRQLEGYIDLLYRSPQGLVVVDYKTSATSDPTELASRVEGYRTQGASYALALSTATGEPVVRVSFVFLSPSGHIEVELDDLTKSVEGVGQLMARR